MLVFPSKKLVAGFIPACIVLVGILSTKPPEKEHYTNLKILSKDLTEDEMDIIMHKFNSALGVTCMYCHVRKENAPYPEPMDFASDVKEEKIVARKMLAMTMKMNAKYFNKKIDNKISVRPSIWCNTCHRGLLIEKKIPG
jgi:hypothetical protein